MISAATLAASLAALGLVSACADHNYHRSSGSGALSKRAETNGITWNYQASYDWGELSEDFHLCQDGSQQSPIPLLLTQGLSQNHIPTFDYGSGNATGTFHNWGYGPAFTLAHEEGNYTTLPSFTFEEEPGTVERVFMTGWHVHAPADHSVGGDRSKAELHFVHVNGDGQARAVLAFRIDPGNSDSPFFSSLPPYISFREPVGTNVTTTLNLNTALNEVLQFREFWTYRGACWSWMRLAGLQSHV